MVSTDIQTGSTDNSNQQPTVISEKTSNLQTGCAETMIDSHRSHVVSYESIQSNIQYYPIQQQQYYNDWPQNHTNLTQIQSTSYDFDSNY